jgi:tetratricopeptide (TPR) repeat protein
VTMLRASWIHAIGAAVAVCAGCTHSSATTAGAASIEDERRVAVASEDGDVVGRWALREMLAPGGTAAQASAARKRLNAVPHAGMWASLASALYDDAHGDPRSAAAGYVASMTAAARSADPEVDLVAWFAVRHLLALRGSVADLFAQNRAPFEALLAQPGRLGWRAVAELEDWRALEVYDKAERTGDAFDEEVMRRMGCAKGIHVAGPFGHGAAQDAARSFAPEAVAPWPAAWPADPVRGGVPRQLSVTQKRCIAAADEQVEEGVFYLETFFTTTSDRELIVAVQGAITVWIDGTQVLTRGLEDWGSWQRFGAHVAVHEGRHRIVAKTVTPGGSLRVLNPNGTAAGLDTDGDPNPPTAIAPPRTLADPNPLESVVALAEKGPGALAGTPPIALALAAYAAEVDQVDDLAATLVEPLVKPADAAALALEMAATFTSGDPALPEDARGTQSRALRDRALARDAELWRARLSAILDGAAQHGLPDAATALRKLADEVPGEPEVLEELAQVDGRLGWRGEQVRALRALATHFPDDVAALRAYLDVLDDEGPPAEADAVAARVKKLDPDAEVDLDRALARQDYPAALAELDRLKKRRPDRKEIAGRVADVLARSGNPRASADALEKALAKHPTDAQARFRLADSEYAKGDPTALRRALAAALQAKASSDELRAAIDVIEGATDLEPFRKDGRAIIRDYQAWEKAGHHMDGTAARVLDYAAIWARGDGSSDMLEHEIQKIQSQEAINAEAEAEPPQGLVLHLRVIKPDGTVLEPEPVAGKATLTLPHLEVGDFIELEHIVRQNGDGARGRRYVSPHWFFREADKGYWRSEFVVVTPKDRDLEIETNGNVPAPVVTERGTFVEHRWRVDLSPPAELEPESPPINEFLPTVRVGWGINLDSAVTQLVDVAEDMTPLDPRLRATALEIVQGAGPAATDDRAQRLYRWVLRHVQDGKETDGRRVVTGGSGSRQAAFRYLLRLLGMQSDLVLVKDGLAPPALGKMSEIDQYDAVVLRLVTDRGIRFLTVRDQFAPYGYIAGEFREQPGVVLVPGTPRVVVHAPGAVDRIAYEGRAEVLANGSARMDLTLTFDGNRAIAWRNALDKVPQAKLYDFVDRELLAASFDGAHVRELRAEHAADLDEPLVLHLRVDVPELAKAVAGGLSVHPPFAPNLAQLASLPVRRTPLLRRSSWRAEVRMQVVLPESAKMPPSLPVGDQREGTSYVAVRDAVHGHAIDFDRVIDLPAGRVQPGADYARWQAFTQRADALIARDVLVGTGL